MGWFYNVPIYGPSERGVRQAGGLSPPLKIPFIRVIFCCRDALVRPTTRGEQYKPFSGLGKAANSRSTLGRCSPLDTNTIPFSASGEATAYTTALLPRLASGKASTLLASLALACAKAYKVLFARSKSFCQSERSDPTEIPHIRCAQYAATARRSYHAIKLFFMLNSSLYVSGPTLQVGPGLCALSFCVGQCRGEKGMRRGGEQQQHNYILAFPSIHEMSPVHWTDG
ncbi:hypothetical protein DEO72_LG2g2359 [Vigna unguiculata]|uniref:Uncharacterized protein n=1 Tax=Vigna unguiculata TaxID=3917 RepID=A0A4D6KVA4_VIGUN|nr:hypothetical protein DEO72_LG2g2359 [Vigna unguiculata]